MKIRLLEEHEGCWDIKIECPKEGCSVQYQGSAMNSHRAECEQEEVTCPRQDCDTRLLRNDMDAHVEANHLDPAGNAAVVAQQVPAPNSQD